VRGLTCSLVVLGQAMFWCVGTFQDSRSIPKESRAQNWRAGPADTASGPAAWWGRAGLPVSEPAGASGYWSSGEPT
jgi:hypothetical protein